jgi:hypothetical protein
VTARARCAAAALAAGLALASGVRAEPPQEGPPPASPPTAAGAAPAACTAREHRAFDFWIGEWRVETPAGALAGHNQIRSILGGCALRESWRGASGSRGTSLNAWDAAAKRWRQTWIDAGGGVLLLEGGLEGGAMVMRGTTRGADGDVQERITWTPLPDGRVKQHWQQSRDGGATWTDAFVGLYARR